MANKDNGFSLSEYIIIDGQQRLTTMMLFLKALCDLAEKHAPEIAEEIKEDYLHNKMESVNDYCSRIKKEPFSKELNEDISWHLYQLMDIFCNCQILYDWNCSPTPLTKALLFCSLKCR